jgi:hypothetical protein
MSFDYLQFSEYCKTKLAISIREDACKAIKRILKNSIKEEKFDFVLLAPIVDEDFWYETTRDTDYHFFSLKAIKAEKLTNGIVRYDESFYAENNYTVVTLALKKHKFSLWNSAVLEWLFSISHNEQVALTLLQRSQWIHLGIFSYFFDNDMSTLLTLLPMCAFFKELYVKEYFQKFQTKGVLDQVVDIILEHEFSLENFLDFCIQNNISIKNCKNHKKHLVKEEADRFEINIIFKICRLSNELPILLFEKDPNQILNLWKYIEKSNNCLELTKRLLQYTKERIPELNAEPVILHPQDCNICQALADCYTGKKVVITFNCENFYTHKTFIETVFPFQCYKQDQEFTPERLYITRLFTPTPNINCLSERLKIYCKYYETIINVSENPKGFSFQSLFAPS